MASTAVKEIERAIVTLTPQELEELYLWLDQHEHPFDAHLQSDLAAGHLDNAIERPLADEKSGRVQPLERRMPPQATLD